MPGRKVCTPCDTYARVSAERRLEARELALGESKMAHAEFAHVATFVLPAQMLCLTIERLSGQKEIKIYTVYFIMSAHFTSRYLNLNSQYTTLLLAIVIPLVS